MGFFEEVFDPDFLFDTEHKQRADIQALTEIVTNSDGPRHVHALSVRVNQLQLVCNALVKMLEVKKIATPEEVEILVQQLDLLDGREDGELWCSACSRGS